MAADDDVAPLEAEAARLALERLAAARAVLAEEVAKADEALARDRIALANAGGERLAVEHLLVDRVPHE